EQVELVVVGDVAVRVAVADRVRFHLRAVGPAAEHRAGAQNGRAAAVRALHEVVVVAAGQVQEPVVADGQPRHLVVVEAAKTLCDDLADVPRTARSGLLPAPNGTAAGHVEIAIVPDDAGGQLFGNNRLGLVELAGGRVVFEDLHEVGGELLHRRDLF